MKGNGRKVSEQYVQILLDVIDKSPSELGSEFGRWTSHRLATYLAEKTESELSGSQVRRILAKKICLYLGKL